MTAGRELDALIAQNVFGCYVDRFTFEYDGYKKDCEVWITDPKRKDEPAEKRQDVTINPKPYSTEISAAWEVVEKLNEREIQVIIKNTVEGYTVELMSELNSLGYADAHTAPLAICLAALKSI